VFTGLVGGLPLAQLIILIGEEQIEVTSSVTVSKRGWPATTGVCVTTAAVIVKVTRSPG